MSRKLALTFLALCLSAPAFAQQTPKPVAPVHPSDAPSFQRGTTTPQAVQGGTPAPPAARPDTGLDPTDANITVELTVIDKAAGSSTTATRLGTITVANTSRGSVRGLSARSDTQKLDPLGLDIDARTYLRKSGLVSVEITVAYIPMGMDPTVSTIQRQSATLFLKPGQETQVLTTGSMTGSGPAVKITAKASVVK